MGKRWMCAGVAALGLVTPATARDHARHLPPDIQRIQDGLTKRTGDVPVPGAGATLHLGDRFYFLDATDAKQVLTRIWGNPPSAVGNVLGMVLPSDKTATDNVWGAVVTYQRTGHVSDDDARTADYNKVLADVRGTEDEDNAERRKQGFPTSHLVGWAQPPSYDPKTHSLIWARDIAYQGGRTDTLNYDVRLLGRGGVLSLNMVSDMDHLGDVRAAATGFGQAANFDRGATYADFSPAKGDKAAGYGLAGLVAAGVGVAAAKKLGFLAIVLGFGKKALVLFAVAFAALRKRLARLFGRGEAET